MIQDFEMQKLPWMVHMGPKCNRLHPYTRGRGRLDPDRRREGNVKTEEDTGVKWPQAKKHGSHQKLLQVDQHGCSQSRETSRGISSCVTLRGTEKPPQLPLSDMQVA